MQTDMWLTDSSNHDQCPMCSKPMNGAFGTCYACGFTINPAPVFPASALPAAPTASAVWIDPTVHGYQNVMPHQTGGLSWSGRHPNPTTPIPARASAQPTQPIHSQATPLSAHRSSKYAASSNGGEQHQRTTGNLNAPGLGSSPIWQYESPNYEAAGSLPALSLFAPEAPTQPQQPVRSRATRRLPSIDEIDTVPPTSHAQQPSISLRLDEAASSSLAMIPAPAQHVDSVSSIQPFNQQQNARALVSARQTALRPGSSWTAGGASVSPYAQLLANPSKRKRHPITLNPLEPVRWWLLRPGRIEFMLWLGGTLLLIGVTCVLLLISVFSFQWLIPGVPVVQVPFTESNNGTQAHPGIATSPGLSIMRVDQGPLVPGQSIQLRGRGFSRSGQVTFSFDGKQPLLDQNGRPGSTRTDGQGSFEATFWLGSDWAAGSHIIIASDVATKRLAVLNIILVAGTNGTTANSASPASTPGVTHTSTPTPPITQASPVNRTPVPASPTPTSTKPVASPSPSPTHQPTPTTTPTVGSTPTLTPTAKSTPTSTPPARPPSPTVSPTAGSPNLGNALNASGDPPFGAHLTTLSPLLWLMVACYSLSMALLGVAGVLYKRRR